MQIIELVGEIHIENTKKINYNSNLRKTYMEIPDEYEEQYWVDFCQYKSSKFMATLDNDDHIPIIISFDEISKLLDDF